MQGFLRFEGRFRDLASVLGVRVASVRVRGLGSHVRVAQAPPT